MSIGTGYTSDLDCINHVVAAAIMSWPMPERIKRLSVPVLSYDSEDFKHYRFAVYRDADQIQGVAAWNSEEPIATKLGAGRLLHGLYIYPDFQGRGLGRTLMAAVLAEAVALGADGLVVKAERPSIGFFEQCGLQPLPAAGPTDYPYQFWYELGV
jgi:GNAT superfamily N-acetyltransferase